MIAKLTALRFRDIGKVAGVLAPRDSVLIIREDNEFDSSGVGYRVIAVCASEGHLRACIGMIPDTLTLEGYVQDSKTPQEEKRNRDWLHAVRAIREQFKLDYERNGAEDWEGEIETLLYASNAGWKSSPIIAHEYEFWRAQDKEWRDNNPLRQVSVKFPVEVL